MSLQRKNKRLRGSTDKLSDGITPSSIISTDDPQGLFLIRHPHATDGSAAPLSTEVGKTPSVHDELPPTGNLLQVWDVNGGPIDHGREEDHATNRERHGLFCSYLCRHLVKGELIEKLDMQEKTISEFQLSASLAEQEKQSFQFSIRQLEQELASVKSRLASAIAQSEKETARADNVTRVQMSRCSDLQTELTRELQLRREAEESASLAQQTAEREKRGHLRAVEEAQSHNMATELQMERFQQEYNSAISSLQLELKLEKLQTESSQAAMADLEVQVADLQSALESAGNRCQSLEKELALSLQDNGRSSESSAELETVVKELREELIRQEGEVREARALKKYAANVDIVKEQLEAERFRGNLLEEELTKARAELEGRDWVKKELDRWNEAIGGIPGVKSPDDVVAAFSDLQRQLAASLARGNELSTELAGVKASLVSSSAIDLQTERASMAAKAQVQELSGTVTRLERKLSLVSRERDSLQQVLASYDEEESLAVKCSVSTPDKAKEVRIKELERTLAACQEALTYQEAHSKEEEQRAAEQRAAIDRYVAEIDELRGQLASSEREGQQLRKEVALLESRVGKGDYNQATTKIVHLARNPESTAHDKAKIAELEQKVKDLEAGSREPGESAASWVWIQEVDSLRSRITALEKKELRLKQIFQQKITTFREACYCLFGFRVDMVEEDQGSSVAFVLRSIFSAREDDFLRFKQADKGKYELEKTEYVSKSAEISRMVNMFIYRFHSIPALTANLTMELFNQQTLTL